MQHGIKKLHRSEKDKIFAGVFGGLSEYFNIDSTILRLAWLLILVLTGFFPGIIVYIIAALIVPAESVS